MSRGSFVWRGFCPRDFCSREICLEVVLSAHRGHACVVSIVDGNDNIIVIIIATGHVY